MSVQRAALLFFITGAGTGYFPAIPGTVATLAAIPLSLGLNRIAGASLPLAVLTLSALVTGAAWFCRKGEEIFGEKDSRKIVIDEIAGFLCANFLSPPGLKPAAAAFVVFRFFDIIKIIPARRAEKIPGGMGVILDDLVAALYTFAVLRILYYWSLL